MVQLKCPVCSQEYTEGADEYCSRCCYLLTTYSLSLLEHHEAQEREKKRLQSAKESWKKWCYAYSDLKQQLETANKGNQLSLNNSLVEQYLSNISSNIQQINEILVSQSLGKILFISLVSAYNINPHSLSQQAITVYETEYSFKQRLLGKKIQPILESNSRGNYWIITEGDDEYLVPKANMRINYLNISLIV